MYATKRNHNNVINATFYFYMSDHIYIASPLCKFLIELKEIRRVCKSWLEFQKLFKVAESLHFVQFSIWYQRQCIMEKRGCCRKCLPFMNPSGPGLSYHWVHCDRVTFSFISAQNCISYLGNSIMKRLEILTSSFLSLALRPCDP